MAALPFAKLGALLLKQLSKPVAKQLSARAAESDLFRSLCIGLGRITNQGTWRMQMSLMGHKAAKVKRLTDIEAVQRGTAVLSEIIIIGVGSGIIITEYNRSARKAEAKEGRLQRERAVREAEMEMRFSRLEQSVAELSRQVRRQNIILRQRNKAIEAGHRAIAGKRV
eukprot:PLAT7489.1.p2 GENE.PLAT7489.1~~PLAT7489.1.p2  ORF type:complete len:168 (+),score=30.99 PLAT7489.1:8-511(+)